MAEVPIQINGVLWNKVWKRGEPVVLYGMASIVGLEVGGGPVYPPDQGGGGGGEHPAFPIWGPPGSNFPGGPGYPPVAGHPLPEPPQQPPEGPADESGFIKPPVEGQPSWAYHSDFGWGWYPSGAAAGPKK